MTVRILIGDARERLRNVADASVNCCVSSPPYLGLRSYGVGAENGEVGLESSPDEYVAALVEIFGEVHRTLRDDGSVFLNLGDSYAGSWGSQGHRETPSTISRNSINNHPKRASQTGKIRQAGLKQKDLIGVPWRVAFALQSDGWWLRSAIVWAKPNGMPGSQEDRCTSSYEMVFHLTKSADYWSDFDAIKTPPREATLVRTAQDVQAQAGSHRANGGEKTNGTMKAVGGLTGSPHGRHSLGAAVPEKERRSDKQRGHSRRHAGFNDRWDAMEREEQQAQPAMMRDVWFVSPASYSEAHFAVMPDEIARRCILAGCPKGGAVLDPFFGAGTTGLVADRLGRDCIGIELNPEYARMAENRIRNDAGMMAQVSVEEAGPLFDLPHTEAGAVG